MFRGELRLVDFDPARGSEPNKVRPAIIVSDDAMNTTAAMLGAGTVIVVPLTSSVERIFDFHTFLPAEDTGLPLDSKAQPELVRAVSIERLGKSMGRVPADAMQQVDNTLRFILGMA